MGFSWEGQNRQEAQRFMIQDCHRLQVLQRNISISRAPKSLEQNPLILCQESKQDQQDHLDVSSWADIFCITIGGANSVSFSLSSFVFCIFVVIFVFVFVVICVFVWYWYVLTRTETSCLVLRVVPLRSNSGTWRFSGIPGSKKRGTPWNS